MAKGKGEIGMEAIIAQQFLDGEGVFSNSGGSYSGDPWQIIGAMVIVVSVLSIICYLANRKSHTEG